MKVSKIIEDERIKQKMTITQLCEKADLNFRTVAAILNGQDNVKLCNVKKICDVLNIKLKWVRV